MISDSYIVPECIVGPGSFGGLMALYESNFIKLHNLLGRSAHFHDERYTTGERQFISRAPRDRELFLVVDSATRYTRDLRMTYLFEEDCGAIANPDMQLRVYADARMTEVVSWAEQHRHPVLSKLRSGTSAELPKRWVANMVLSKWLDYLIDMGHAFDMARSREAEAIV